MTIVPGCRPLVTCVSVPLVTPVCMAMALMFGPSFVHTFWGLSMSVMVSPSLSIASLGLKRSALLGMASTSGISRV